MDPDIADRIEDWPSRSIDAAHEGLRTLADVDFSGALRVEDTWVYLLDGQIVGIHNGEIDDLAETAGSAYQAPGEALPLLFAMQSGDDAEPRAQYYTEETPLADVDETLSAGGFTGYLELSENVLSGDYYVVYHGGQSRAVAVVGTREEVILGQEAYELAADEVGIYEVIEAPISITPLPSGSDRSGSAGGSIDDQDEQAVSQDLEGEAVSATEETSRDTDQSSEPSSGSHGEPSHPPSIQDDADETAETEDRVDPVDDAETSSDASAQRSTTERDDHSEVQTAADTDTTASRVDSDTVEQTQSDDTAVADRSARQSDLEADLAERTEERDRLRERIEELESALDAPDEQVDSVDRQDRPWAEVVGETSLFLRYDSQSEPTLDDLPDGVDKEALAANLALDYHTNFDDSTVSIDGVPFPEALHSSPEWSFLRWLVRDLPFEIRDTGRVSELRSVYDALPSIDRIELESSLTLQSGTDEPGSTVDYDFICRDKTGNPLVVADIHEGREPVDGPAIEGLIDRTSTVVEGHDSLVAAYAVSPSFFRPDALEKAQSATESGFLSRDARLSYVKVDRNVGYHLWLVEARNDNYHVTVPDL
jgi:hypothetical protein